MVHDGGSGRARTGADAVGRVVWAWTGDILSVFEGADLVLVSALGCGACWGAGGESRDGSSSSASSAIKGDGPSRICPGCARTPGGEGKGLDGLAGEDPGKESP